MTQERNSGFYPGGENENPYDPATENFELELTPQSVAEFAADFKRVVDIAKWQSVSIPRDGLYFFCPPNRKIGYVENPSKPGNAWRTDARLYNMTIGSAVGTEMYYEPLVTLTNAPHAFERKDGAGFQGAKIQFGITLFENGRPETYRVYFWETEPASLKLMDDILNSFMFESIDEVPEAVRNGVNRTFTPMSTEPEIATVQSGKLQTVAEVSKTSEKLEAKKSALGWLASVISQRLSQLLRGKAS